MVNGPHLGCGNNGASSTEYPLVIIRLFLIHNPPPSSAVMDRTTNDAPPDGNEVPTSVDEEGIPGSTSSPQPAARSRWRPWGMKRPVITTTTAIRTTTTEKTTHISELLNYVYGKTSVQGQMDRFSTIMRAYEGREAVLLELLETKALIKANKEKENTSTADNNLPSFLRNSQLHHVDND
jgi:hypothetical protein